MLKLLENNVKTQLLEGFFFPFNCLNKPIFLKILTKKAKNMILGQKSLLRHFLFKIFKNIA